MRRKENNGHVGEKRTRRGKREPRERNMKTVKKEKAQQKKEILKILLAKKKKKSQEIIMLQNLKMIQMEKTNNDNLCWFRQ